MEFKIWMDHKNLQYFIISQKLNQRQVWQTLYLSCFNFTLKHIPKKSIDKANGLSQRADWQERVEKDNKDRILIKLEWIREVEMLVEDGNLRERIKKAQKGNKKVVKVVEELKRMGIKSLQDEKQLIEERVVMKEK